MLSAPSLISYSFCYFYYNQSAVKSNVNFYSAIIKQRVERFTSHSYLYNERHAPRAALMSIKNRAHPKTAVMRPAYIPYNFSHRKLLILRLRADVLRVQDAPLDACLLGRLQQIALDLLRVLDMYEF